MPATRHYHCALSPCLFCHVNLYTVRVLCRFQHHHHPSSLFVTARPFYRRRAKSVAKLCCFALRHPRHHSVVMRPLTLRLSGTAHNAAQPLSYTFGVSRMAAWLHRNVHPLRQRSSPCLDSGTSAARHGP